MAADLTLDVAELQSLLRQSRRSRVQAFLSREIQSLEKAHSAAALDQPTATPAVRYTTLSTLSWEQDREKVKIYVPIEGASEQKLASEIQPWSFDIRLHDVDGKNYRCAIQKLNKSIVPEESHVAVKPKRIVVTLKKADRGDWKDLYFKEDKFKSKEDSDEKDPMGGLMDLMKNMYDDGDDEMKKNIAQAWTEARAGKRPDPLRGY